MSGYRCGHCGITYPQSQQFRICPVHGEATKFLAVVHPTEGWEARMHLLLANAAKDAESAGGITRVTVTPRQDEEGRWWIHKHYLIRAGFSNHLPADTVLELPTDNLWKPGHPEENLWEVEAYRDSTREYWVRPLRVPDYPPDGQ